MALANFRPKLNEQQETPNFDSYSVGSRFDSERAHHLFLSKSVDLRRGFAVVLTV
jgi:hypothetical protein